MEDNRKFPLSHTVLYCKGWYEQSENVFDDLRKVITADGYSGEFFSDNDIIRLLLGKMDDYFDLFKKCNNSLGISSLYDYIERYDRIEEGFKEKSKEYKLWRFFRCHAFDLNRDCFVEVEPDYTILPKKRWYKREWLDTVLFNEFCHQCFEFEWNTFDEFKKRVAGKSLKKALKEICEKYPNLPSEYEGTDNIVKLVKDDFIAMFQERHPHQLI